VPLNIGLADHCLYALQEFSAFLPAQLKEEGLSSFQREIEVQLEWFAKVCQMFDSPPPSDSRVIGIFFSNLDAVSCCLKAEVSGSQIYYPKVPVAP
jgi:hypothetical protein